MRKLLRWSDDRKFDRFCNIGFRTGCMQISVKLLTDLVGGIMPVSVCRNGIPGSRRLHSGEKTCIGGYCCKSDPKRNQKILSGISGYSRHYYRRTHRYIWIQICMWCGGTDIAGIKTSLSVRLYGNRSWRSRFDRGWHSCHVYDVDRKKHLSQLY